MSTSTRYRGRHRFQRRVSLVRVVVVVIAVGLVGLGFWVALTGGGANVIDATKVKAAAVDCVREVDITGRPVIAEVEVPA